MKLGVLALQGAFIEHVVILKRLGVEAVEVRLPEQLNGLSGLIIPGGESTTMSKLMREYRFVDEIKNRAAAGLSVFGTCAGMILMAKEIARNSVEPLGLLDITVERNAFGRQLDSFEAELPVPVLGEKPFPCIFIRAPLILRAGAGVEVLTKLDDGRPVAVRQGNFLALAFHPELSPDTRFHEFFLKMAARS